MATPKHRTIPGCSYFVTTKCWQGRSAFSAAENVEVLLETLFHYRDAGAYLLHEFVVMPDHIHLLLTPGATTSLEKAVQFIKGGSSHRIHAQRQHRSEIWQIGFYDWTVRDSADWNTKVEYIRMNPVRARLAASPEDWPYSSASGRFRLDAAPNKYSEITSGAKAPIARAETAGLKPRPPKKQGSNGDHSGHQPSGAKAPAKDMPFMSELKLRPPKKRIVSVTSPEVIGEMQVGREGGE